MTVEEAHPFLEGLFQPEAYYAVHLNLIRLGREICPARRPKCGVCPLQKLCSFENKCLE
jgi:endonuclease-3